jgi:predicted TIM-barrel fold metal-dependent hydrolase
VIDTHAHVFTHACRAVAGARYVPAYEATVESYLALLDAYGLTGGVLVQPSFLGADNSFMLQALAHAPTRLRGVAVVDEATPVERLPDLAAQGVRGLRFNFLGQSDRWSSLENAHWKVVFRQCATLGWHLEVHDDAPALAAALPLLKDSGLPIVLDHFGRPADTSELQRLIAAARGANVYVKCSGKYRFKLDANEAHAQWRDALGDNHLLWGSDWPWTNHESTQQFSACVADGTRWLAAADVAAKRLFGL